MVVADRRAVRNGPRAPNITEDSHGRLMITMCYRIDRRTAMFGGGATLLTLTGLVNVQRTTAFAAQDDPIKVTTTVGMIADSVRNIGGDAVDVTGLMGPGVDPHLYKPAASDISALSDADLIFYGGLELEGRMTDVLVQMATSGIPTVAVAEKAPEDQLREPPEFQGKYDPHIWFSVLLWKTAVEAIREALVELDSDQAEMFDANAEAYQQKLDELDTYVREQTERVTEDNRVLVTAHDAFGYFGEEYGYEVYGLQGISTAAEAGAGDVQDLSDMIVEREIPAIFVESSVPPGTIEAVQEACKSKGWNVQIGGELFSDAMGEDGTPEGTYIGMVEHNIDTIVAALLGES